MTDKELKKLKDDLWHSADMLRAGAHLAANKYGQPILGLIFLRYADILYKQHKSEIDKRYNELKGGRIEKSIEDISKEVCGFYLPEEAYFDFINNAPDDAEKATLVKKAMQEIEKHNKENDCWVILYDKVYDLTEFINEHPGGKDSIMLYAGKDATEAFDLIHDESVLDKYTPNAKIGEVQK